MKNLIYKIKNFKTFCEFSVHYDQDADILHIFDKGLPENMTVTNAVGQQFINFVLRELDLDNQPNNIWLYGTDGIVSEFEVENNSFHFVPEDLVAKIGYKEFVNRLKKIN